MTRNFPFGIVGWLRCDRENLASELWKSCGRQILVGGRDLAGGKALVAELENRVSAAHLRVDTVDTSVAAQLLGSSPAGRATLTVQIVYQ